MFQVASHPPSFTRQAHPRHQSQPQPGPSLQLPRTLARPQFIEVSRDSIIAASPDLAKVPSEYIRRGLYQKGPSMLAGLAGLASFIPSSVHKGQVPPSISVPIRAPSSSYPTHVLAVSSAKPTTSGEHTLLFPVHAVILAAQCAQLPTLPPSTQKSASSLHLPVLPLSLPSATAFTILHTYLYSHRLDMVLKGLFPMPAGFLDTLSHEAVRATLGNGVALHNLSLFLCTASSSNLQALMAHAAHVKELWQDMIALGLHDPELWDTVDLAWEVIIGALNLAAVAA